MNLPRRSATLATLLLAASAGAQQQTIPCPSAKGVHACPAYTLDGVLLVHERSVHKCIYGRTWRFDDSSIRVSGGCDADFLVNQPESNTLPGRGYRVHGTGENAAHTNGRVQPSPEDATPNAGSQPGPR